MIKEEETNECDNKKGKRGKRNSTKSKRNEDTENLKEETIQNNKEDVHMDNNLIEEEEKKVDLKINDNNICNTINEEYTIIGLPNFNKLDIYENNYETFVLYSNILNSNNGTTFFSDEEEEDEEVEVEEIEERKKKHSAIFKDEKREYLKEEREINEKKKKKRVRKKEEINEEDENIKQEKEYYGEKKQQFGKLNQDYEYEEKRNQMERELEAQSESHILPSQEEKDDLYSERGSVLNIYKNKEYNSYGYNNIIYMDKKNDYQNNMLLRKDKELEKIILYYKLNNPFYLNEKGKNECLYLCCDIDITKQIMNENFCEHFRVFNLNYSSDDYEEVFFEDYKKRGFYMRKNYISLIGNLSMNFKNIKDQIDTLTNQKEKSNNNGINSMMNNSLEHNVLNKNFLGNHFKGVSFLTSKRILSNNSSNNIRTYDKNNAMNISNDYLNNTSYRENKNVSREHLKYEQSILLKKDERKGEKLLSSNDKNNLSKKIKRIEYITRTCPYSIKRFLQLNDDNYEDVDNNNINSNNINSNNNNNNINSNNNNNINNNNNNNNINNNNNNNNNSSYKNEGNYNYYFNETKEDDHEDVILNKLRREEYLYDQHISVNNLNEEERSKLFLIRKELKNKEYTNFEDFCDYINFIIRISKSNNIIARCLSVQCCVIFINHRIPIFTILYDHIYKIISKLKDFNFLSANHKKDYRSSSIVMNKINYFSFYSYNSTQLNNVYYTFNEEIYLLKELSNMFSFLLDIIKICFFNNYKNNYNKLIKLLYLPCEKLLIILYNFINNLKKIFPQELIRFIIKISSTIFHGYAYVLFLFFHKHSIFYNNTNENMESNKSKNNLEAIKKKRDINNSNDHFVYDEDDLFYHKDHFFKEREYVKKVQKQSSTKECKEPSSYCKSGSVNSLQYNEKELFSCPNYMKYIKYFIQYYFELINTKNIVDRNNKEILYKYTDYVDLKTVQYCLINIYEIIKNKIFYFFTFFKVEKNLINLFFRYIHNYKDHRKKIPCIFYKARGKNIIISMNKQKENKNNVDHNNKHHETNCDIMNHHHHRDNNEEIYNHIKYYNDEIVFFHVYDFCVRLNKHINIGNLLDFFSFYFDIIEETNNKIIELYEYVYIIDIILNIIITIINYNYNSLFILFQLVNTQFSPILMKYIKKEIKRVDKNKAIEKKINIPQQKGQIKQNKSDMSTNNMSQMGSRETKNITTDYCNDGNKKVVKFLEDFKKDFLNNILHSMNNLYDFVITKMDGKLGNHNKVCEDPSNHNTNEDNANQNNTNEDNTNEDNTNQNNTNEDNTNQNNTNQNNTNQNNTNNQGDDHYGDDLYGDDLYGDDHYGDDHYGDDHYGDDLYGDDLYGDDHYGDNNYYDNFHINLNSSLDILSKYILNMIKKIKFIKDAVLNLDMCFIPYISFKDFLMFASYNLNELNNLYSKEKMKKHARIHNNEMGYLFDQQGPPAKKTRKNNDTDNEMKKNVPHDEEENNIPMNEVNKRRNEEKESTTFDNSTLISKNDCKNSDYNIFNIFCNNKKGYLFFFHNMFNNINLMINNKFLYNKMVDVFFSKNILNKIIKGYESHQHLDNNYLLTIKNINSNNIIPSVNKKLYDYCSHFFSDIQSKIYLNENDEDIKSFIVFNLAQDNKTKEIDENHLLYNYIKILKDIEENQKLEKKKVQFSNLKNINTKPKIYKKSDKNNFEDPFRNRKTLSSRAPSKHVDDYEASNIAQNNTSLVAEKVDIHNNNNNNNNNNTKVLTNNITNEQKESNYVILNKNKNDNINNTHEENNITINSMTNEFDNSKIGTTNDLSNALNNTYQNDDIYNKNNYDHDDDYDYNKNNYDDNDDNYYNYQDGENEYDNYEDVYNNNNYNYYDDEENYQEGEDQYNNYDHNNSNYVMNANMENANANANANIYSYNSENNNILGKQVNNITSNNKNNYNNNNNNINCKNDNVFISNDHNMNNHINNDQNYTTNAYEHNQTYNNNNNNNNNNNIETSAQNKNNKYEDCTCYQFNLLGWKEFSEDGHKNDLDVCKIVNKPFLLRDPRIKMKFLKILERHNNIKDIFKKLGVDIK